MNALLIIDPQNDFCNPGDKYGKDKGLSQLELSLQMGYKSVSVVSGSEICYGNKHFNLEQLLKISQILDVELCDFFKE